MGNMCKKFGVTFLAFLLLVLMAAFLFLDNLGAGYTVTAASLTELPAAAIAEKKRIGDVAKTCLFLRDSTQENNEIFTGHLEDVLGQLRVGYRLVDVSKEAIPPYSDYRTVVIGFQDLEVLGGTVVEMCDWVKNEGGGVMFFCTPNVTPVFRYLGSYLGIDEGGVSYTQIAGMQLSDDFMIGSRGFRFHWEEPMSTALNIRLCSEAKVYAASDDENRVPLVWEMGWGKGRFVVNNHGFTEKAARGLTAAAYCLTQDVAVYPVINASAFFLDDFPSPVPMGDGRYIREQYNRDISSFYSAVWWPDMLLLCEEYGIKYTGMLIEDYTEEIDGLFPRQKDTERFQHFGAMLLDHGGEIGLHGYNHLPLCFTGFDFMNKVDYDSWTDVNNAVSALREALNYTASLFPENTVTTYVPPSNILSDEGRDLLKTYFPQIRTICSLYIPGEIEYIQEFGIGEDGIVNFPRVISGAVLDQYMYWDALNALNMYYVNSHFMHPDDVLDEDRGAADGWAKLYQNLTAYADWLYTSAPHIRNMTAGEASCATQRYDVLSVERTDTEEAVHLRLGGFWDEAWLMVRFSKGTPGEVTGGTIERVDGDYYLLHATADQVVIRIEEE